ncbi:MAG: hypothetical protein U0W24_05745 [Bacteroidales bacterium]
MKRLLQLVVVAGMMSFLACGPSAEDQAKEQARLDSLKQDSIAKAEEAAKAAEMAKQDSIAKAAEAQRVADSIAAASKGKKK